MAQVPPAATSAVPSSRVHRLVSDGPAPRVWVMPDLTGRAREDAETWIARAGFRRGVVKRVPAAGKRTGTVVSHTPLAGYPIRSLDIVELVIAE